MFVSALAFAQSLLLLSACFANWNCERSQSQHKRKSAKENGTYTVIPEKKTAHISTSITTTITRPSYLPSHTESQPSLFAFRRSNFGTRSATSLNINTRQDDDREGSMCEEDLPSSSVTVLFPLWFLLPIRTFVRSTSLFSFPA